MTTEQKKGKTRNIIIAVAVIFAIFLIGNKVLNSKKPYQKNLNKCISAFINCDSEDLFETAFPEYALRKSIDDYYDDNTDTGNFLLNTINKLSKDEYITSIMQQGVDLFESSLISVNKSLFDYYGNDMKISYEIISEEELSDEEIKQIWNDYKTTYSVFCYSFKSSDITKGKKLELEYECKGEKNEKTGTIYIDVFYVSFDGWIVRDTSLGVLFNSLSEG